MKKRTREREREIVLVVVISVVLCCGVVWWRRNTRSIGNEMRRFDWPSWIWSNPNPNPNLIPKIFFVSLDQSNLRARLSLSQAMQPLQRGFLFRFLRFLHRFCQAWLATSTLPLISIPRASFTMSPPVLSQVSSILLFQSQFPFSFFHPAQLDSFNFFCSFWCRGYCCYICVSFRCHQN